MKRNTPWFWLGKIEMSYDVMAKIKIVIGNRRPLNPWSQSVPHSIGSLLVAGVLMCIWRWGVWKWRRRRLDTLVSVAAQLSAELVRYFPSVTGDVIKVDGKHIYIDLGAKDEVWIGLRLLLFREGEALTHPTTGAVVGHDELQLGEINARPDI